MARRGNGAGYGGPAKGEGWGGPANGEGWGGPARGIGRNSRMAAPFEEGNRVAEGVHSFERSERRERLLEHLCDLAMHSESEMVRVRACTAALDILEGPCQPINPTRWPAAGEQSFAFNNAGKRSISAALP